MDKKVPVLELTEPMRKLTVPLSGEFIGVTPPPTPLPSRVQSGIRSALSSQSEDDAKATVRSLVYELCAWLADKEGRAAVAEVLRQVVKDLMTMPGNGS